jgi:hypothetical protein
MPKQEKKTALSKKDKKKEAAALMKEALAPGSSATIIQPPSSPESEDGHEEVPTLPQPASTLPDQNKVEIKRVIKKVRHLEEKIELAYEHSRWACPSEVMDGLGSLKPTPHLLIPLF